MITFGRRVVRRRGGRYELKLDATEAAVLGHVAEQLREAILTGTDDPMLRRLFPPAYVDDREKEAGYQALARDELLEARLASLDELEAALAEPVMDAERAGSLLRSCNALRLVLGTRLDVSEDEGPLLDEDDPDAPLAALYGYLGFLLENIVDALAESL